MECAEKKKRKQTAAQKVNNFLASEYAKQYFLTGYACATLYALAKFFYYREECWPSLKSISAHIRFSERQIKRAISELEKAELITIVRKNGAKNKYILTIPEVLDEEIYDKKSVDKDVDLEKTEAQ